MRWLKLIFTVNFLISMLAYGGYIVICLMRGMDIDAQLGVTGHHGRGGPAWAIVAFLEAQLLAAYLIQHFSDDSITFRDRAIYLLWGALIMLGAAGQPLLTYVGCSDVVYGLFGSNDT